jgi:hypothetical protein
MSMNHMSSHYAAGSNGLRRLSGLSLLVMAASVLLQPADRVGDGVIDAVTAATLTSRPQFDSVISTPSLLDNRVTVTEGATLTMSLKVSDPYAAGYGSVYAGTVDRNGNFYFDGSNPDLPSGVVFSVADGDATSATLTWTPPIGASQSTANVSVILGVSNTYSHKLVKRAINIRVVDASGNVADGASTGSGASIATGQVKKVTIAKALWRASSSTLFVRGKVVPRGRSSLYGQTVTLNDADTGDLIGMATVKRNKQWVYSGTPVTGRPPCRVQADIGGKDGIKQIRGGACGG